ncbi:MAG TPA: M24 family metallopeptidase [Thermodesulfobacteriota bacterium]|nr:M24 family metallopeptidase [Thermodesulfobacteriota bacterium]
MKLPTLSFQERDRRWNLSRELMKEKGLDCLIVPSGNTYYSPDYYDAWLTNDNATGIVVFPLKGEPCYIVWSPMHGTLRMVENRKRGIAPWLEDYRVYRRPIREGLVPILREKSLESANMGVVNLIQRGPGALGGIAYGDWAGVLEQLPRASFVDIEEQFAELKLVKSEEEIALARYSAKVGEKACEAMLNMIKPGVSESEIYATIMYTILAKAANSLHVIMQTGVENLSWGMPVWTYQAQVPRVIGKGDLVEAEIFPMYGGIEAQQQMAVATKPVAPLTKELADIARRSYKAAITVIRPGKTFGEVYDAMKKPLDEAGCWHITPLLHTLSPNLFASGIGMGIDQVPELKKYGFKEVPTRPAAREFVLKKGVMLELEPNACRGNQKVNIGGTVIVTEDGVEELNKLATKMHVIG